MHVIYFFLFIYFFENKTMDIYQIRYKSDINWKNAETQNLLCLVSCGGITSLWHFFLVKLLRFKRKDA